MFDLFKKKPKEQPVRIYTQKPQFVFTKNREGKFEMCIIQPTPTMNANDIANALKKRRKIKFVHLPQV